MTDSLKHVSFDLDGTLIDSVPVMRQAWKTSTEELKISCGFAEYHRYLGLPFPQILKHLGLSAYEVELTKLYFSNTRSLSSSIPMMEGARELLEWCRQQGLGLSVVTSKPRANAEFIMAQRELKVDVLVCGDDHQRGKPDPSVARPIFEAFEIEPSEAVYVGDAVYDYQFALNAGMRFIYFANQGGNRLPENLLNTVTTIQQLADLPSTNIVAQRAS